jgi:type I restriction enzyme S subunit
MPLEDCTTVIQGQSPPGNTYNTDGDGLPFFQGKAEFGEMYPTTRKWCTAPAKIAEPDDILISIRAPVGPTNLNPEISCIGRGLAAVRAMGDMPAKYILYWLRNTEDVLAAQGTGSTFSAISGKSLRNHQIPIAPLPEQHRIVAAIEEQFTRLDAAVAGLKRTQANLKRYRAAVLAAACSGRLVPTEADLAAREGRAYEPADQLLQRILLERRERWESDQLAKMQAQGKAPKDDAWKSKNVEYQSTGSIRPLPQGWASTNLGQLSSLVTSGSRGWARYYSDSGATFIRAKDINTDALVLDSIAHVRLPNGAEGIRTRVQNNDLLVTITGANVTKTALVQRLYDEAYVSQHVGLVRPVIKSTAHFLYYWVISPLHGRRQLEKDAYGAGKPGLNLDDLRQLPVALPPLDEQIRIIAELEQRMDIVDVLEDSIVNALKRAVRLRQSILRRAFEGTLVPQDPTDEPADLLLERIKAERTAMQQNGKKRQSRPTKPKNQRQLFDLNEVGENS